MAQEILVGQHDQDFRNNLEAGFVGLETFIPDTEFEQVKAWGDTFHKGQEIIKKAKNPNDAAVTLFSNDQMVQDPEVDGTGGLHQGSGEGLILRGRRGIPGGVVGAS